MLGEPSSFMERNTGSLTFGLEVFHLQKLFVNYRREEWTVLLFHEAVIAGMFETSDANLEHTPAR
jgi:hypothetical protein